MNFISKRCDDFHEIDTCRMWLSLSTKPEIDLSKSDIGFLGSINNLSKIIADENSIKINIVHVWLTFDKGNVI